MDSTLFFSKGYGRLVLEVEIMNGLIDFLTTEEMIVVYSLIGIASVLGLILFILDKTANKRRQRQNTRELQKIVDENEVAVDYKNEPEPVLIPIQEDVKATPVIENALEESKTTTVNEVKNEEVKPVVVSDVQPEVLQEEKIEVLPDEPRVDETVIENKEKNVIKPVEKVEELQYTSIEPDPTEAQAELMRLTETLEKAEEEVKNIDLTAFEEEQEQNAIISMDELMTRGRAMYESGELDKLEDEGDEPISLQDLEARMNANREPEVVAVAPEEVSEPVIESVVSEQPKQMVLDDFQTVQVDTPKVEVSPTDVKKSAYSEHKKFKSSPVISPVFGIEKPVVNNSSDLELENTANYEKLDEEIRKTNEFLMTLKELQKKLD